jgi:L-2,4-diaminobutyrate decarboxylase
MSTLPPIPETLRNAYDPERFRADGHRLVDALAEYLTRATARDEAPVLPWVEPARAVERWPAEYAEQGSDDLVGELERAVAGAIRLHHPRYLGHQVPPPMPGAALADLVAALLNNGMAVYEMGPSAVPAEVAVVRWMAARLGMPPTAGGILTSGGSLGNLTALLAARQARAGFDAWTAGDHAGPPLAVLCSAQAHYSVSRAIRMMGWGDGGAIAVPDDDAYRLDATKLEAALNAAAGKRVIGVVASAGSTGTGAFDPLDAIADFCAEHQLWLHVDGAHGASAALSAQHAHLVKGIERADSVTWDAHKMMAMPALITGVVFRDGRRSYEAFAQEASYLYAAGRGEGALEWFNPGLRTLECTKRMMSTIVDASLKALGVQTFRDYVDRTFALGQALAAKIAAADDFELITPPAANIVCWRWRPAGAPPPGPALDDLQATVRRRVLERGRFYILQTRLATGVVLRSALMNPLTEDVDLDALLVEIRSQGADLVRS